jgi:hypothetical protein
MKKSGIILNLACVVIIVIHFELVRLNNWNPQLLIYEIIPILVLIITYIKAIKNTGLWKLIHLPAKEMNETDRAAYLMAINEAYIYFSIFTSAVLILYTVCKIGLNMVMVMALVYLAHILPAYFLGWTKEK